jgi:hypothetical protein
MFSPVRSLALSSIAMFTAILCWGGATCYAQNSDGGLELHANSRASASDIGLPAYPGATLYKTPTMTPPSIWDSPWVTFTSI